jgi:hypothetical protein
MFETRYQTSTLSLFLTVTVLYHTPNYGGPLSSFFPSALQKVTRV